jgi:hypothetical protein
LREVAPAIAGFRPAATGISMSLSFPNVSRSYDSTRRSVSFWGHDACSEITFDVGEDALQHVDASPHPDEATSLRAFDANRSQIEHAAAKAYTKRRQTYLRLSASDF